MLIRVTYTDERFDYVKDSMLEALIEAGAIARFQRSTGWVEVGTAPIRKKDSSSPYCGIDRRKAERGSSYQA